MATMTSSAAVAVPSFTGLRAAPSAARPAAVRLAAAAPPRAAVAVKASLRDLGAAAAAAGAAAILAGNAMAAEVLLGGDDGSLAFIPKDLTVAAGEEVVFKNNAGFPHNVVFDEDAVPEGVDVAKISMDENDLLNGPGDTYKVALPVKGTYGYYCSPHQGAGMVGTITVN